MKLSIIVPMYNVEKYIGNCLNTLLNQKISDDEYEILIINDGSTDKSGEIAKSYEEEYKNIKVITVSNGGLSKARNIGIENALGDYIFFVDSDDYISERSIHKILDKTINNNLDIMFFDVKRVDNEKELNCSYYEDCTPIIKSGIDHFTQNNVNNSACHYLISRKFISDNNLKFQEGRMCEDGMFLISSIFKAKRVSYSKIDIYRYVIRSNSITTRKTKNHLINVINDFIFAIKHINKYYNKAVEENYPIEFIKKLESRRNSYIFFCQIRMIKCGIGFKEASRIIRELEEIDCYKYTRMNKNDYPGLKTTIIWKILNLKYIFNVLCINRDYKKEW